MQARPTCFFEVRSICPGVHTPVEARQRKQALWDGVGGRGPRPQDGGGKGEPARPLSFPKLAGQVVQSPSFLIEYERSSRSLEPTLVQLAQLVSRLRPIPNSHGNSIGSGLSWNIWVRLSVWSSNLTWSIQGTEWHRERRQATVPPKLNPGLGEPGNEHSSIVRSLRLKESREEPDEATLGRLGRRQSR
jgi:hypothetical protein